MEVQPDFRDLLALLNEHKVDFLIADGYALALQTMDRRREESHDKATDRDH